MTDAAMDLFAERYRGHLFHERLNQVQTLVAEILSEQLTDQQREWMRRLDQLLMLVNQTLEAVIPSLSGIVQLNEIQTALDHIINHLNQFRLHRSDNFIQVANDHADSYLLPSIRRLPTVGSTPDVRAVFSTLDSERKNARSLLNTLEEERVRASTLLEALVTSEGSLHGALARLRERIDGITAKTDEVIADFNKRSTDAERNRDAKFSDAVAEMRRSLDILRSTALDDANKLHIDLTHAAQETAREMDRYRDDAARLLGVIGGQGASSPFGASATQDRKVASRLRMGAGACFVVMLFMFGLMTYKFVNESMAWEYMLFRFMTVIVFGIPAIYFARESSKFQNEADRNRRFQLELASVGPFIENLSSDKKEALKEELTKRYFAAAVADRELEKPLDPNILVDLLKAALTNRNK